MTVYVAEEFTDRGGRHPPAVLHQPRRPGVRPGQPARGGQGRPVRPLLAVAQEPAPAVPRRVRRRARHHRRRRHRRHRRPAPGRGALRPGVLRVRRRLGGPARRRPPGLRAGVEPAHQGARVGPAHGLPRAVDPLHRLRHPPRRALPLLPRPRACCSSPLGTRYVGDMDRLFDTYAELRAPAAATSSGTGTRRTRPTPTSSTARPSGPRRSTRCGASCRRPRCPTSGIYGTGQGYEQLLLRMRAHPLPEARAYADLMLDRAAQGHPVVPQAGRPRRPGRGLERPTSPTTRRAMDEVAGRLFPPDESTPEPAPDGHASSTSTPTPRSSWSPPCSTPTPTCPRHQVEARVRKMTADERLAVVRAYVGDRAQPPPQAGPGPRAHRLPLRRPRRLRRLPRPPAPPHAHHRVAARCTPATATPGPRRSTHAGAGDRFDEAMDRSAALYDALGRALPGAGALRRRPGLPGALRDAAQRPGGDAPHRAAHRRRRATRPTGGSPRRCTG